MLQKKIVERKIAEKKKNLFFCVDLFEMNFELLGFLFAETFVAIFDPRYQSQKYNSHLHKQTH